MHPTQTRILVADDDHDTADTTADLLRLCGYEVQAVYDGLQAVKTSQLLHPHVVVLDINMPVMSGLDAAREIRQALGAQVVLIAHTAQTGRTAHDQAGRAGFDHHLLKPVDTSRLLAVIAAAAGRLADAA